MKRIFITGIAGFIGFHLAKYLKSKNIEVIGIDNFNDYYDVNLKKLRKNILEKENIKVIKLDINEKNELEKLLKENKITHFVNLAAQAGVRYSIENPYAYLRSNIDGFVSVLEVLKDKDIKLIFASSSSVYGDNKKTPFSTLDRTDTPTNLYGATKKANESLAYAYNSMYNTPMIGLRFFTVYGPYGRPDMAYYSFTKDILEKKPIKIFNNGNMQRDFTYIDDIISGIYSSLDYETSFEIFNLGNNKPINLLTFISIIEKRLNIKAIKEFMPFQKGEMLTTFADIENSKNKLNFNPKTSIEKGIDTFISWYEQEMV
ncbi:MAG: dTDP-L-rhamnose 4-epimerase [Candidatus Anoxychlamydiales bacterium]|nr:dTDP-L-rhamnose 4-epimerase [Candidatus Anoxychlamydiales bacterium]